MRAVEPRGAMAQDLFQYEKMVENALRGVVRDALRQASRDGLRGAHRFYIGFAVNGPGVAIPDYLRDKYPEEMTIVLEHQYWDLEVDEAGFAVTLSFHKQLERLTIPFVAIRSFTDPSVNFALEFAAPPGEAAKPGVPATVDPASEKNEAEKNQADKGTADVVTLDSFRKR
jgi:hypothetical protein